MSNEERLHKTFKCMVEVSPSNVGKLWSVSRVMVNLWNELVEESMKIHERRLSGDKKAGNPASYRSWTYWLTHRRKGCVVLDNGESVAVSDVSSDCQRGMIRSFAGAFASFFALKKKGDKPARTPWKKEEGRFHTLSWSSFSIRCDNVVGTVVKTLRVSGFKGEPIEITLPQYLVDKISGVAVVYVTTYMRDGKFWLSLVTSSPRPKCFADPKKFRAIDFGAGDIAVADSSGSEFLIPARRPDKFRMVQILAIEKRAGGRTKGSAGHSRLAKKRRRIFKRMEDQRTSHQRKLADALTGDGVECIVIGKTRTRLGLAQSETGTSRQHFGVQNTGYMQRLVILLNQKAAERGIKVVEFPDPKRSGPLDNPESKLVAARSLLASALKGSSVSMPKEFFRKNFSFAQ